MEVALEGEPQCDLEHTSVTRKGDARIVEVAQRSGVLPLTALRLTMRVDGCPDGCRIFQQSETGGGLGANDSAGVRCRVSGISVEAVECGRFLGQ